MATYDVICADSSVDVLWNLDNFSGDDFASVRVLSSYRGNIGLPEVNKSALGSYPEYRPTYFQLGDGTLTIGEGSGGGSKRLKFDYETTQMTATVYKTGARAEPDVPACLLKTTHASSSIEMNGGDVGIAALAGEASTIAIEQTGGVLHVGAGATLKSVDKTGGTLTVDGAATSGSETLRISG